MATNKKFRIQNGANIEGELSFNNQTVINNDGTVVASSVQPAITATVDKSFVDALNVSAFDALTAQSVTDISSFSTTDVSEGANLYFTEQRARGSFVGGTGVSYDDLTGEMSLDLTGGEGISVSGNEVSFDGSSISQDIVPSVDNTYSLGSPDKVWRDVYIGPGSLYINGTKILEDNNGTITMYADPGQVLSFGTSGGGNIDFNAGDATIDFKSDMVMLPGKTISTSGGNATEFGGDIEMSGNCIFGVAIPQTDGEAANKGYVDGLVNNPHSGDKVFNDDVTVGGNLTVQGTVTTVNSETISLADNIIDLNSNVISGAPSENGGIRVLRGDQNAAQIRWNEANDHWEMYDGSSWTKIALSTDDLAEGSNKYFTDERVNAIVGPIETALQGADSAEKAARIAGDAVLQSAIDAEEAARISADSDLGVAVAQNASDIVSGDSATLQSAKDYADGHKSTADTKFGIIDLKDSTQDAAIAQNAADIVSGDSATLQSAKDYADGLSNTSSQKDGVQDGRLDGLDSDLAAEVSSRTVADAQLQSAVDGLSAGLSARETADGVLQQNIDTVDAKVDTVDAKVDAILGTSPETLDTLQEIVAAFEGVDSDLQGVITNNSSRLTSVESDVNSLDDQLNTLTTRVGNDEADLSNEITRSTDKDAEHDSRLDALEAYDHVSPITDGDSDTLVAAKAYTDQEVSSLNGAISGQLSTLNTTVTNLPIASGDATTLQAAKDYADQQDTVVRQEFGAGDSALNDALSQEIASRISGDASLQSNIDAEASTRSTADGTLQDNIDAEALARSNADANLQSQLDLLNTTVIQLPIDEKDSDVLAAAKAYADAGDSTLQTQLNFIKNNTDSVALDSLTEIVAAFQDADSGIQGVVSDHGSRLITAEQKVSAIENWSTTNLPEGANKYFTNQRVLDILTPIKVGLDSDINAEESARTVAIALLQSAIDAEAVARSNADGTLQDNIDAEALARSNADTGLDNKIDSLAVTLRQEFGTGDDGLNDALAQEIADRIAGDSDLGARIDSDRADMLSGDVSTLSSAKAYTDTKVGDLSQIVSALPIESGDSATLADAKAYTDTKVGVEAGLRSGADSDLNDKIDLVDGRVTAILGTSPETLDTLQEIVAAFGDADAGIQGVVADHGTRLTNAEADVDALEINVASLSGSLTTLTGRVGDDEQALADEIVRSTVADAVHDHRLAALEAADAQFAIDFPAGDSATLAAAKAHADAGDLVLQGQLGSLEDTVQALPIESGDSDTLAAAKAHADAGDVVLDTKIDNSLVTIRQEIGTGDDALNSALSVEVAARIAGDSDLDDKIDAEAVTRANADTDLQNQLNTLSQTVTNLPIDDKDSDVLAAAKAHADAKDLVLQGQIDNILANTDSDALNSLSEIVTAFQEADGTLTGAVSANSSAITQVSNDVSSNEARISSLEGGLQQAKDEASSGDSDLDDKIDAEIQARSNADTALQDQINVLESSVQALPIESGDSDTLAAAKAHADAGDSATLVSAKAYTDSTEISLQQEISSGDSSLNDAIIAGDSATLVSAKAYTDTAESALEAKDATQDLAIQANAEAIAQEVLDRTSGDNQLQSAINSLTSGLASVRTDFGTGDSALNDAIQAVDSRVDAILDGSTVDLDSLKEVVDAFQNIDADLQVIIDNNSTRLNTAESNIDDLELAMASRISEIGNINTDITTKHSVTVGLIDAEATARIAGDSATLASAKAHANTGDASLQSQLDSLQGSVQALPIESGDSDTLEAAKAYTDTKVAQGVTSSKSYTDGIFAPIINIEIPGLEAADSDLDVRVTALEDEDVSLSGRLDSDRLEWIGADSALDARVTTLENEMDTVESRLDSDRLEWIGADSDLNAKIEAETLRATGVEGGLQNQINNLLSNTDETALNSLAEIVTAFQGADGTLTGLVSSNAADIDTLQADVSGLQAINAGGRLNTAENTLVDHGGRIGTLESEMNIVEQGLIDLPGQIKSDLSGGLCITYSPVTGVIEIDEAEVRAQLVTHDADNLGGNDPSHYRINVYRVDGQLVN